MFGATILTIATALGVASAQTGPGFPIPATSSLIVKFGNNTVSPAGELIPRPETANPPNISTTVWYATNDTNPPPGVLLIVDLDVPRNGSRVQLVHQVAVNVTLGPQVSTSDAVPLVVPNGPVPYLQPSPPVGDVPHSYNIIVFQQPDNFSIPAQYSNLTNNRVFFNVTQFVLDTGLGLPIAGSYFQVQNLTGTPTTTYPPARSPTSSGGSDGSSPVPFPGAAMQLKGERYAWAGISTALLAGLAAIAL